MTLVDGRHDCGAPVDHHAFLAGVCFRCERLLEQPPEVVWRSYRCDTCGHRVLSASVSYEGRTCGAVPSPYFGVPACTGHFQLT